MKPITAFLGALLGMLDGAEQSNSSTQRIPLCWERKSMNWCGVFHGAEKMLTNRSLVPPLFPHDAPFSFGLTPHSLKAVIGSHTVWTNRSDPKIFFLKLSSLSQSLFNLISVGASLHFWHKSWAFLYFSFVPILTLFFNVGYFLVPEWDVEQWCLVLTTKSKRMKRASPTVRSSTTHHHHTHLFDDDNTRAGLTLSHTHTNTQTSLRT